MNVYLFVFLGGGLGSVARLLTNQITSSILPGFPLGTFIVNIIGSFAAGMLMARIVNPLVIGLMFFVVITPIGLLMRAFGQRPLSLQYEPDAPTYWIERKPPGPPPESMGNQF